MKQHLPLFMHKCSDLHLINQNIVVSCNGSFACQETNESNNSLFSKMSFKDSYFYLVCGYSPLFLICFSPAIFGGKELTSKTEGEHSIYFSVSFPHLLVFLAIWREERRRKPRLLKLWSPLHVLQGFLLHS